MGSGGRLPGGFKRRHFGYNGARFTSILSETARWQSGDAAACKAAYTGSIPVLASSFPRPVPVRPQFWPDGSGMPGIPGMLGIVMH